MRLLGVTLGILLVISSSSAQQSSPTNGTPVPLFPKLTWGASEEELLREGLVYQYKSPADRALKTGISSAQINGHDFFIVAHFGNSQVTPGAVGLSWLVVSNANRNESSCREDIVNIRNYLKSKGLRIAYTSTLFNKKQYWFGDSQLNNLIFVADRCPNDFGLVIKRNDGREVPKDPPSSAPH